MVMHLQQAPAANGNAAGANRKRPNYKEDSDSDDDVPLKDKVCRCCWPFQLAVFIAQAQELGGVQQVTLATCKLWHETPATEAEASAPRMCGHSLQQAIL